MSATSAVGSARKPFYNTLTFQLVLGLAAGGAVGLLWPQIGAQLNPLAAAFVKLIKMVAGLIVFLTVVAGFAQIKRGVGVGRLSLISVCYFEVVSTLALLVGLTIGNLFEPGKGLALHADAATAFKPVAPVQGVDFVMSIIPKTVVDALAGGIMLQILLVALLFGYALYAMGEKSKPAVDLVNLLTDATFKVVNIILKLAPIGVFGAAAFLLGKYGIGALMPLMKLVGLVYLGCLFLIVVVFSIVAWLTRFSLFGFFRLIREELIIAFTTTSSEAALPGLMKKLEQAGCSKATVGFVVPTGYSLNLDGSSIYITLAALFIAQAAGLDLTFAQQAGLLLVFLLTSKGVAGVTGGAFVTLSASLLMFPEIPAEGLALILGVDRLMDTMRTLTNVAGNGVATMAVSYWQKERVGFLALPPEQGGRE
ncbi:cation:dicarboxylate symporter family transporter [Serratia marcescens]|jgi:aerobic C4-dicarboxylate transport protein|uniref:C4-dicarboxylate transporter n=1 Tax=Serratia marcescens TaxID=615 RepID=A0AAP8TN09_SERMA|nr:cation:dicarboxylase symporter family transporter [Serratia marcescens]PNO62772.1 C4-dicarboxylate transporter [Serratia marcescens]